MDYNLKNPLNWKRRELASMREGHCGRTAPILSAWLLSGRASPISVKAGTCDQILEMSIWNGEKVYGEGTLLLWLHIIFNSRK